MRAEPVKQKYACAAGHEWRDWGTGPLTIIIAGQDRKMMELELWNNKVKPLLRDPAEWREVRQGQALQHAENKSTGDMIVFISHADSSQKNIKHMQGYVAHYVWLDEMPASVKVLEELQRRVDSRGGYFLSTFTPKFKNLQIKKIVEASAPPQAKRYKLSKFDNPIFSDQRKQEEQKLVGHSPEYVRAVLEGDWMSGDGLIHQYVPEIHGGSPEAYHQGWRHAVCVDPATESKLGLTIWAEDPTPRDPDTWQPLAAPGALMSSEDQKRSVRQWWCVRAEYIEGIYVPTRIVAEVESRLRGLNVCLRRADPEASWFIRQAAAPECGSLKYEGVEGKNRPGRKDGLIRNLTQCLGRQVRLVDEWTNALVDELGTYERNPDTGKIVAASKYHLIDSAHYFADCIPAPTLTYVYASFEDRMYHSHLLAERRAEEARAARRSGARYTTGTGTPDEVEPPLPHMRQPGETRIANRSGWRRTWRTR